jgi:hypothetical protein
MNRLNLINVEINNLNGFTFNLLQIEYRNFEGSLLGLNFGDDFFHVKILFLLIEIKRPW